jgi:hypothetical protein
MGRILLSTLAGWCLSGGLETDSPWGPVANSISGGAKFCRAINADFGSVVVLIDVCSPQLF